MKKENEESIRLTFPHAERYSEMGRVLNNLYEVKNQCVLFKRMLKNPKKYLIDVPNVLIFHSLYNSIAVGYAKNFLKEKNWTTELKKREKYYLEGVPENLKQMHFELIEVRIKYFAHSSDNNNEEIQTVVKFFYNEAGNESYELAIEHALTLGIGPEKIKNISLLVDHLVAKLKVSMINCQTLIMKEIYENPQKYGFEKFGL